MLPMPTLMARADLKALVPQAQRTADAVNEFVRKSYEVLDAHPVNIRGARKGSSGQCLLPRGRSPEHRAVRKRYGDRPCVAAYLSLRHLQGVRP